MLMKKPQFSERESKSNSNAEDLLRQLGKKPNPRDPLLYKGKKQSDKASSHLKECPSPQEILKKSKKNCRPNPDTIESFRKKKKAKETVMSICTRESKHSLSKKLKLNQSANPEFKNLISIEMSQDFQEGDLAEDSPKVACDQQYQSIEVSEIINSNLQIPNSQTLLSKEKRKRDTGVFKEMKYMIRKPKLKDTRKFPLDFSSNPAFNSNKKNYKDIKKSKNTQYIMMKHKNLLYSFASLKRSSKKKKEYTERSLKGSQIKDFAMSAEIVEQEITADKDKLNTFIENPNIVNYLFENLISKVGEEKEG